MLPEADRIRIQHMLDAARQATLFIAEMNETQLTEDLKTTFALVKCIEIIGEAAGRVSEPTLAAMPQIPWRIVKAMRNRLVHVYFDVDTQVLWSTVTHDLPPLVRELENALRLA